MKKAILLTGSNAAGKTTTVERALEPWKGELDTLIMSVRADNDGRFKGQAPDQEEALRQVWFSDIPVVVFEGTRINTPLMRVAKRFPDERSLIVLMVTQTREVMRAHLVARCEKKGKVFRADYWDRFENGMKGYKLHYEGSLRYPNNFKKNGVRPIAYAMDLEYTVTDQIVDRIQQEIREALDGER